MRFKELTFGVTLLGLAAPAHAAKKDSPAPAGRYAMVNDLKMYYEVHGTGRPLVLLHGGVSNIQKDFGKLIPTLAKTRKVIALEQQGHGRTGDIDRPLTYEQMASDTVALLQQLKIDKADVLGYSMGAAIALEVAVRHPDVVDKLVLLSPAYRRAGFQPGFFEQMEGLTPDVMKGSPWQQDYARIAPNPENWPALVGKIKGLMRNVREYTPDEIRAIKAPTLVVIGDSDMVRPEHAVEMFRLRGGGGFGDDSRAQQHLPPAQLAILPGTSHVTLVDQVDLLRPILIAFLATPPASVN